MNARVGIIGFGFMGRTHLAAFRADKRASIVAVADGRIAEAVAKSAGLIDTGASADLSGVRTHTNADDVINASDIDLISICTPTPSHVELATRAMRAGKHVLLEKPVALDCDSVRKLMEVERETGKICMPAMCMRFWPGWVWLKEAVSAGTYGKAVSAVFQRLGTPPDWNPNFYGDLKACGGALFDLHIHDADFVYWCFGKPDRVSSIGSPRHVTTQYFYNNGPRHVIAEGGQDHTPGFGFRMRYTVAFERATAEFDLGRSPQLMLYQDGKSETISTDGPSGYDGEVSHLLDVLASGDRLTLRATLADALAVTEILQTELAAVTG